MPAMRKVLIIVGIGVVSWGCLGQISSRVESFIDMKSDIEKFESTADKFEINQKTGWVTLTGHVKVITDKQQMAADQAKIHRESGTVQANGHVVITQSGLGEWRGDSVEYNYKTGKGLAVNGYLKSGVFSVYAKEMARTEAGLYRGDEVTVTTCTNDLHHLHWCLTGDARVKDGEYVEVYDAVPYMFGVPFLYLPYCYRAMDLDYGVRVYPGYASRWGGYVLLAYKLNIYRSPKQEGIKLDATSHLEFRTKRGVGVGETLEWDLKRWGEGEFSAFHFWDIDPSDGNGGNNWVSKIPSERYKLSLVHETDITPRDLFLVRGSYLSDSEVLDDYFRSINRTESIPVNFVSYEHREHALATGATVSGPLNDFYGGVSRLPEGWLDIVPTSVFNTGINYESQSRVGYLDRQAAYYDAAALKYAYYPGDWADYQTLRGNTAHRLTYPVKLFDALSIVPRTGYQGTYYQDSETGNTLYRNAGEVGAEASMRFVSEWRNGWRHTLEPYVDYSWQPVYWNDDVKDAKGQNAAYMFDKVDRALEWQDQFGADGVWLPYNWHGVRPGLRNLFQTKSEKTGAPRTFLDIDVYGAVQMENFSSSDAQPNIPDNGLRMAGMKTIFSPIEAFESRAIAEWDTVQNRFAYVDLGAHYKVNSRLSLNGGYMGRDHELYDYNLSPVAQWNRAAYSVLYTGFFHEITDAWAWSMYVRYDTDEGALDEVGGFLQYSLDCLVFQLRTSYNGPYTRLDGSERDSDFRVSAVMWFRAMQPQARNSWDRW